MVKKSKLFLIYLNFYFFRSFYKDLLNSDRVKRIYGLPLFQIKELVKYICSYYLNLIFKFHIYMLKNPEEFKEYHRQYREQRKTWDIIPYEYWIKRLKKFGENYVIGDFGCGEGKIGQDPQLSSRVKSFDHVSIDDFSKIIPCDMTDVLDYVNDGGLNAVVGVVDGTRGGGGGVLVGRDLLRESSSGSVQ